MAAPRTRTRIRIRTATRDVALIHNGIIENFLELRERLSRDGHVFASETDTEVLVHLIESNYHGDLVAAVRTTLADVRGAFSVAVVSADHPGLIVAAKRVSPLIVGQNDSATFLASDPTALIAHTREMVHVLDDQLVEIRRNGFTITTVQGAAGGGQSDSRGLGRGGRGESRPRHVHAQGDLRAAVGHCRHPSRPRCTPTVSGSTSSG